jgi:hypothetical protein
MVDFPSCFLLGKFDFVDFLVVAVFLLAFELLLVVVALRLDAAVTDFVVRPRAVVDDGASYFCFFFACPTIDFPPFSSIYSSPSSSSSPVSSLLFSSSL